MPLPWSSLANPALVAQSTIDWSRFGQQLLATVAYTLIGLVFFGLAFWLICRICPFSVRKEIEEDQNTSLGILIGSVIIGIALIIAAAVHG
jgi:uncharacterized membrane protein YjfL (UPF0719 family)